MDVSLSMDKIITLNSKLNLYPQRFNANVDDDESLFQALFEQKKNRDSFHGAGVPRADLGVDDVVPLIMRALEHNSKFHTDILRDSLILRLTLLVYFHLMKIFQKKIRV